MGGYGGGGGYGQGGFGQSGGIPYAMPSLGYYLTLLTSQYQNSPKLKAFLTAMLQVYIDAGVVLGEMPVAYDLDFAIGPQLDTLGELIGVGRIVSFQPSNGVSPVLTDPVYRLLLRAKIAQNQWDGTLGSLYAIWKVLFPGGVITVIDNQDMTAFVTLTGSFSSIVQDLIVKGYIVPRPEGVLYNIGFGNLPAFGFDNNNAFVAGFDIGMFA